MTPAQLTAPAISTAINKVRSKLQAASTASLSDRQAASVRDVPTKHSVPISRITFPSPVEDDLRQLLFSVVRRLGNGFEKIQWPEAVPVEAECTTCELSSQTIPGDSTPETNDQYMKIPVQTTILYVHGGAFYLNSPASSRSTVSKLCDLTKGRCVSVKYRLAPQNPFPAAILDVLVAYISLLYPPPASTYAALPSRSIILAGDSAGANLCFAVVQTILRSWETYPTINFNEKRVPLVLPGGLAILSVAGDLTQTLPSWTENATHDILRDAPPTAQSTFPSDHIWPSKPPRTDPYCDNSTLCHPLVAPAACTTWKGAPPFWIACGQERLADSSKIIAQTAARQSVTVLWQQYEAMPHTFAQIFPAWPQSLHCMESWARACRNFAAVRRTEIPPSGGVMIRVKAMEAIEVSVTALTSLDPDKARLLMEEKCRAMLPFVGSKIEPSL